MSYVYVLPDSSNYVSCQENGISYAKVGLFHLMQLWADSSLPIRPGIVNYNGGWEWWVQRDVIGAINFMIFNKDHDNVLSVNTEMKIPQKIPFGKTDISEKELDDMEHSNNEEDYVPKDNSPSYQPPDNPVIDWVFNNITNNATDMTNEGDFQRVLLIELKAFHGLSIGSAMEKQITSYVYDIKKLLCCKYNFYFEARDVMGIAIILIPGMNTNNSTYFDAIETCIRNNIDCYITNIKERERISINKMTYGNFTGNVPMKDSSC